MIKWTQQLQTKCIVRHTTTSASFNNTIVWLQFASSSKEGTPSHNYMCGHSGCSSLCFGCCHWQRLWNNLGCVLFTKVCRLCIFDVNYELHHIMVPCHSWLKYLDGFPLYQVILVWLCTGSYLTKSAGSPGAGDLLMGFLGSVILSFAFSMFRQREVD